VEGQGRRRAKEAGATGKDDVRKTKTEDVRKENKTGQEASAEAGKG